MLAHYCLLSGHIGEIITRGPHIMKGYWDNPEATRSALSPGTSVGSSPACSSQFHSRLTSLPILEVHRGPTLITGFTPPNQKDCPCSEGQRSAVTSLCVSKPLIPSLRSDGLAGGWLRTGDSGWIDQEGQLWLTGRLKDLIRSGSENVAAA